MNSVTVIFPSTGGSFSESIKELENKNGLNPSKVGMELAKMRGGKRASLAAQYCFFRRGERRIPDSLVPYLAKIFNVTEETLHLINAKFDDEAQVQIRLDPTLKLDDFWDRVPDDCLELGKFLIWLSTEQERRRMTALLKSTT